MKESKVGGCKLRKSTCLNALSQFSSNTQRQNMVVYIFNGSGSTSVLQSVKTSPTVWTLKNAIW